MTLTGCDVMAGPQRKIIIKSMFKRTIQVSFRACLKKITIFKNGKRYLKFERSKKDSEDLLTERNERIKNLTAESLKISDFVDEYLKQHSVLKSIENLCDKVKPNAEATHEKVTDMEVSTNIFFYF